MSQAIVKPMSRLATAIQGLARGELDIVVPERLQRDEIKEIGDTLAVFKANMIEADRLRGEQETQKQRSAQEGRRAMLDLAAKFEASVGGIVEGVVAKATELQGTAQAMAATAEETIAAVDGGRGDIGANDAKRTSRGDGDRRAFRGHQGNRRTGDAIERPD